MSCSNQSKGWQPMQRTIGQRLDHGFLWGRRIAPVAFAFLFAPIMFFGGPGSHQSPVAAFVLAGMVYVFTAVLVAFWQRGGPWLLGMVISAGIGYTAYSWQQMEILLADYRVRMALSDAERALLQTPRFDLKVAIDPHRHHQRYAYSLETELEELGLFTAVGPLGGIDKPDFVARVEGGYYGDRQGQSFTLLCAGNPAPNTEKIDVWRWVMGRKSQEIQKLYQERLAVEVIRTVQALQTSCELKKPVRLKTYENIQWFDAKFWSFEKN